MELLEIKNLYKSYGEKQVLKNINLTVPRGKIIGLLGKNGTGKTTLIKLINGLLTPSKGEIIFEGEKIGPKSKLQIAYLPERTYLDKSMSIKETLNFFKEFYTNFDITKAKDLLKKLDLDENQKIIKMSKGIDRKSVV